MELDLELRKDFSERVKLGVKELIELNQIEDLEEFDGGLFISNVFEREFKKTFDLKSLSENDANSLRSFLWSAVYSPLEVEKYEKYIQDSLNK